MGACLTPPQRVLLVDREPLREVTKGYAVIADDRPLLVVIDQTGETGIVSNPAGSVIMPKADLADMLDLIRASTRPAK